MNSLAAATYTADAIRRYGAMPSLELSHSGMYAGTYMTDKSKQHSMNSVGTIGYGTSGWSRSEQMYNMKRFIGN